MSQKIKCSHILVEKQSQALQIFDEIRKGKNLVQLLEKFLQCPSGKKDGDLGYFTKE